jgi:hypothetical protein
MHTSALFRSFWLVGVGGAVWGAAAFGVGSSGDRKVAVTQEEGQPASGARPAPGKPDLPEGWRLLYSQAFDDEAALGDFEFSDPQQWRWVRRERDGCLEALPKGTYRPKLRSPFVIALLRDRRIWGPQVEEAKTAEVFQPARGDQKAP